MLPGAEVVAALIEIAGVVPPELTIGSVPVTAVTVPAPPPLAEIDGPFGVGVMVMFVPATKLILASSNILFSRIAVSLLEAQSVDLSVNV
jgi:hypothetical protein